MVDTKHSQVIKTPALVQEFIELKRLTTEIPTLKQKNECLRSEITSLEVQLSELEAKLSAKENDLKKFLTKFPNDIDTQIKILELER